MKTVTTQNQRINLTVIVFGAALLLILILMFTSGGLSNTNTDKLEHNALVAEGQSITADSQAPSDRVFLTERVPVRTHSRVTGLPPGTALHVISTNGDTSHVTDGTQTFDVSNNKLTTDASLAARLAQNEYAAQEAAAQQMDAYQQAQAAKRAEQERQAADVGYFVPEGGGPVIPATPENLAQFGPPVSGTGANAARAVQAQVARDLAAARQAEQRWQAELQRRRDKEDYIFYQQHKTPDVIVIGRVRSRISAEVWEQVKTAYATDSIGLREIARNMNIPEGTVLTRAKREGWTREIQSAKALAKREDAPVVTATEARRNHYAAARRASPRTNGGRLRARR
jgi:hypothetical protein